jgi:predicted TIM-barrel fold metal-dependent hydrolase
MKIDAHQHFWQYHPAHQVWMTDAMQVLRRDYLPGELEPLLTAIVVEAFGTERVMIGSDWPVCALSGSYVATMNIVIDYVQQFPAAVRDAIFGGNCARFYQIKPTLPLP